MSDKHIIVDGDPLNGFGFCGPFDTIDDAQNYIIRNLMAGNAWIVTLAAPTPDYERYQQQWVDTREDRPLTFDECARLGLDGTGR